MNSTVSPRERRGGIRLALAALLMIAGLLVFALIRGTGSPRSADAAPGSADAAARPAATDSVCLPQDSIVIERELEAFVEPGTRGLCAVRADLNADGADDYVLVLEPVRKSPPGADMVEEPRPLRVLVRGPGGALRVAGRNDRLVFCARCGGMFDPFDALSAGPGTFRVSHYGGAGWRWRAEYTFRYDASAGSWRLAQVTEVDYHAGDPEGTMKTATYTAPRDFGVIDVADFDPDEWNSSKPSR